ncbi:dolichol kinase [Halosegnis sp.]|uniref:dolichol kinase n=1 Tax=Halosegnis sp. TaxID=2864959 RepID=UPI0035D48204
MGELGRRAVHASGALAPLSHAAGILTWPQVRWTWTTVGVIALALEFLRLYAGLDLALYDRLTREYEQNSVAGYALYMVSGGVVLWLVGPAVGTATILMLALGDPVSGLLSSGELRTVKRPRVLVGMFLACTALAAPFVPPIAAAAGALGATIADGVKPRVGGFVVDDNLTIPPLAAAGLLVGLAFAA